MRYAKMLWGNVRPNSQIQSDWEQATNTEPDYIKNKPTPYSLPVATPTVLGGVKLGSGINITPEGVISVATTFLALTDVVDETYVGKAWNVPKVSDEETDMELVETEELETEVARFPLLSDVPQSYVGFGGMLMMVKTDESGIQFLSSAPTYADNAAALTGGLISGQIYKTSDGTLKMVY